MKEDECLKVVNFADRKYGGGFGLVVQEKGANQFAIKAGLAGLEALGMTGDLIIQFDPEKALKAYCRALATKREGRTLLRQTPKGSKGSLGGVERLHQTIKG